MKKFYIFAFVAMFFAACTTDQTTDVDVNANVDVEEQFVDALETLTVSFEEDTRIQLQNGKTVWNEGDLVSVFYLSNANQKWQFQGKTGDRTGTIKRVSAPEYTAATSKMVVAYPYNENYYLNPETCNLQAFLPAEQTYLEGSYGLDGNIMVSQSEYKQFYMKSVCGWLKLQLTGNGEVVKSITLKGNNGEQAAGEIYVNTADASSILAIDGANPSDDTLVGGTMFEEGTILTEVTLDCGEGVELGAEATAFYIALPPQSFEKGFTAVVECADGSIMTKKTSNPLTIERNTIQPMAALEYVMDVPLNEIWYTSSDGEIVTPNKTNVFGANIKSNTYENGKGVITFDASITSIGASAFSDCSSLTSVTIPNRVTSIGVYAFSGCSSLTSITIPDSVTSIGYSAFEDCSSLTSITIPNRVTSIGEYTFSYCSSLTSITIPNSVTSINQGVFYNCSSLISVTIPDSVTEIKNYTFYNCSSLTSGTIPNSVTSIGNSAFSGCSSLTSVIIPESVTSIGDFAFSGCRSLTSVYCKPTTPPAGDYYMFYNNATSRKIYVPASDDDSIINAYKSAEYWSGYASSIFEYDFSAEQ